jgi:gamma-glutamyltranspeptidase/glutathione hydrolase
MTIVDKDGNALVMTTTVESGFGSFHMTQGFILNNQLTDFSATPTDNAGAPIANSVAAGKRPRSSMAPTFVFAPDGSLRQALGSAGGNQIINYVAKALVGTLDWKLSLQQAIAAPNMGSRNGDTEIERGSALESVAAALQALGHPVQAIDMVSGTQGVARRAGGPGFTLTGGADPRREGVALGNPRRDH